MGEALSMFALMGENTALLLCGHAFTQFDGLSDGNPVPINTPFAIRKVNMDDMLNLD